VFVFVIARKLSTDVLKGVDMGCETITMTHMETTQHINPDHFLTALDAAFCDAWSPNDSNLDENGWVAVNETIDCEWDGDIDDYRGAVLSFFMRHTVIAFEPQCYEGYGEYEGTVAYEGHTYKFHIDTYTNDSTWTEVK
jgi:hypothetical protein